MINSYKFKAKKYDSASRVIPGRLPGWLASTSSFFFPQGYKGDKWTDGDDWHYVKAYKAFKEMYPRISTGSPLDPWRLVQGDVHKTRTQKTCRLKCLPTCFEMESSWNELEPLHLKALTPQNGRASQSDKSRESTV